MQTKVHGGRDIQAGTMSSQNGAMVGASSPYVMLDLEHIVPSTRAEPSLLPPCTTGIGRWCIRGIFCKEDVIRHFISLGPTPPEEPCAQVGEPDYRRKALAECQRFIVLLRETFGPEPEGAELQTKSFPHDFGTYYEVVCCYDPDHPASMDYAFRLEKETPSTWEG
jgi:hypothetical protein